MKLIRLVIAKYLGTDHNEIIFDDQDITEIIFSLGMSGMNPFQMYLKSYVVVSKVARNSVKVVLSGDGGMNYFVDIIDI